MLKRVVRCRVGSVGNQSRQMPLVRLERRWGAELYEPLGDTSHRSPILHLVSGRCDEGKVLVQPHHDA